MKEDDAIRPHRQPQSVGRVVYEDGNIEIYNDFLEYGGVWKDTDLNFLGRSEPEMITDSSTNLFGR